MSDEPLTLADLLACSADDATRPIGTRWARIRFGERDPIPRFTRRLVYERDGFTCNHCGGDGHFYPLQLDHIVPWSAGGSDRSDNLQTLCSECNADRSNFVDSVPPRVVGVTDACSWCLPPHPDDDSPPVHAYCGRCGVTSWVNEAWLL